MNLSDMCNRLVKKQAERGYFVTINVYEEDHSIFDGNTLQYDVIIKDRNREVKSGVYHQRDLEQAIMLAVIKLPAI